MNKQTKECIGLAAAVTASIAVTYIIDTALVTLALPRHVEAAAILGMIGLSTVLILVGQDIRRGKLK